MLLYHFSEDPTIQEFVPRTMTTRPGEPARVWAIDAEHAPLYWLPRDCPRVCFWALPTTTPADRERFLGQTTASKVIAIESGWVPVVQSTTLYAYEFDTVGFEPDAGEQKGPGYYVSTMVVTPLRVAPVGDLFHRLTAAAIELRLTPSLWPLYHALLPATLHFSMIRMRNARPDSTVQASGGCVGLT